MSLEICLDLSFILFKRGAWLLQHLQAPRQEYFFENGNLSEETSWREHLPKRTFLKTLPTETLRVQKKTKKKKKNNKLRKILQSKYK